MDPQPFAGDRDIRSGMPRPMSLQVVPLCFVVGVLLAAKKLFSDCRVQQIPCSSSQNDESATLILKSKKYKQEAI